MKFSELIKLPLTWACLLGLAALLGIGATVIQIDDRYAHAEEMELLVMSIEKLNKRINDQAKADQMMAIQKRIWQIQDHYRDKPMPPQMREELRFLQAQLERLKRSP